jgi:hypothetical protein
MNGAQTLLSGPTAGYVLSVGPAGFTLSDAVKLDEPYSAAAAQRIALFVDADAG